MHLFQSDRSPGLGTLIRVFTILGLLLIVLAVLALLGDIFGLLDRFRSELYLFVIGALLAYLMAPAVRILQRVLRLQWAAVLAAYLLLFAGVLLFGALLLTPFISQAQSLVKNMRNPSTASLAPLHAVQSDLAAIQADLRTQQSLLANGRPILLQQVRQTQSDITRLVRQVSSLTTGRAQPGKAPIPPSYANSLVAPVNQLQATYGQVTNIDASRLASALAAANAAATQATTIYKKASTTPLLLLSLQTTLDQHGITVDLHDRFNQLVQSVNKQVASLLNNALSISLQAGNLLIDTVLIFIISIYFVSDGRRFIQWLIHLVPAGSRYQVSEAVAGLDQILGSYLRTQIVLALLAGISDASGAFILGIPYPIVIFFSSFLLSVVPVIGPVILPFPPLAIALIFSPLPRPLVYLAWLLVGEQIITNVVGPRLQGHNLRIHPLEAMAAALVGLPLAGIPGAFFAVPIVAFIHIVIRELAHAGHAATTTADGTIAGAQPAPDTRRDPAVNARDSWPRG
ncbi:MAG TPA: AI-2E family transporter [Chloroflexota bacterium]|nr:AI-2E family transporter [Chloroflexota bacterium]